MRRVSRRPAPRIIDPATHPRPFVSLTVAATFLEMDRRALNHFIAAGKIPAYAQGRMRKLLVSDLVAFKSEQERPLPALRSATVSRATAE